MHLINLPLEMRSLPSGLTFFAPAGVGSKPWAQASSIVAAGRSLVWVDAENGDLHALTQIPTARYVGRCAPVSEARRLRLALRTEAAPKAGATWRNRDEYVAMYAALARDEEVREIARRNAGLMALTVLNSDTFNRSDRALNGDTMSDGLGVWTATDGTNPQIISNQCGSSVNGATRYAYDNTMGNVDVQRSSVTRPSAMPDCGPTTRMQSTTTGYWLDGSGGVLYIFRENSGITLLTSGGTFIANDIISLDSSGNDHTGLVNGVSQVGPTTDSNFTTGKAGLGTFATTSLMDDWQVEVADTGVVKTVDGLAFASVKTVDGVAIASVKTINGVAAQ